MTFRRGLQADSVRIASTENLNDIWENGWYDWEYAQNAPFHFGYMEVISSSNYVQYRAQIAYSKVTARMCRRLLVNGQWTPWMDIAIAEPPTWYNLQLANGIVPIKSGALNAYCKDQFGRVTVNLQLRGISDNPIANNTIISVLPEGFRPSTRIADLGIQFLHRDGTLGLNLGMSIYPNGEIAVYALGNTEWRSLTTQFTFLAD